LGEESGKRGDASKASDGEIGAPQKLRALKKGPRRSPFSIANSDAAFTFRFPCRLALPLKPRRHWRLSRRTRALSFRHKASHTLAELRTCACIFGKKPKNTWNNQRFWLSYCNITILFILTPTFGNRGLPARDYRHRLSGFFFFALAEIHKIRKAFNHCLDFLFIRFPIQFLLALSH